MIKIEIWSDINCPFCYIGKRRLEAAIDKFDGEVEIEWRSFELDPYTNPPKGANQTEILAKKYGKPIEWAVQMNENMTEMARDVGLDFHMDKLVPANSFHAHRLIHLAKKENKQDAMKERFLKARFTEGKDIGNRNEIRNLAVDVGLDPKEVDHVLESEEFSEDVRQDEEIAAQLGIGGVPFFVLNKRFAVRGTQSADAFLEALQRAKATSSTGPLM